ncbi:MAG: hypothetical protein GX971_08065 [Firmicutes bacterium]|jgi:hypothetical protein|nr:hypothetical protein [Bacillota bacterium]
MKYHELFQFEPITSVIQLTKTGEKSFAKDLVRSFVVSQDMENLFVNRILPNLQFDSYVDNKALMIVGNYGTGKSHMMGVIASIAEDAGYLQELQYPRLREKAECIAGKFKVLRLEIGGVATPLEHIILRNELEPFLQNHGIAFDFPQSDTISNFKRGFEMMMEAFSQKYPNTGLLLVIDEMLEFLQTKEERDLIRDLGFLRQMAEFCQYSKFRLIFGVQESIFDNPKFKFVASAISKIKERTEIAPIIKSDIKFVVEERILKKTANQKAIIREYLEQFRPYYHSLSSDFEEFVNLFPVHPDFLNSFERMIAIEKREVLRTISNELLEINDKDLPEKELNLITIDKYWPKLNATINVFEGMKEVRDCYNMLVGKLPSIKQKMYRDMALRIINGLSIQRMEDTDVSRPIGLTPVELRDSLCLFESSIAELGSEDLDNDLLTHIETTLKELMKAVNGQFISRNQEGQYYIDIRKTVDFDQIIETKAQMISNDLLDQYYFELLKQMLECQDELSFQSNSKIWDYELQWLSHKMFRKGWLFFGLPNERPTAIPEKAFYLFFIPPMTSPRYLDEKRNDELILKLEQKEDEFVEKLRLYAATSELASMSSAQQKSMYQDKASEHFRFLAKWFLAHLQNSFTLTYRGSTRLLKNWLVGTDVRKLSGISDDATLNFKDAFDLIASYCLRDEFHQQASEYPTFSVVLTSQNYTSTLNETCRYLVNRFGTSKLPMAILSGLGLVDNSYITPKNSKYAQWILEKLQEKPSGVVLRRDELFTTIHGEEYLANPRYRLEKEFVSLLLVTLVSSGDIILKLRDKNYDASNLKDFINESVEAIADFDSINRPKDWNPAFLKAFVKLFDLPEGNTTLIQQGKESVIADIQSKNEEIIKTLAEDEYRYRDGLVFWGESVESQEIPTTNLSEYIAVLKKDFEKLRFFNSTGKLKNPNITVQKLEEMLESLHEERHLVSYVKKLQSISSQKSWFESARLALSDSSDWIEMYKALVQRGKDQAKEYDIQVLEELESEFITVKNKYIRLYSSLHANARLSENGQVKLNSLLRGDVVTALSKLQQLSILSKGTFEKYREDLLGLKPCSVLTEKDLDESPICPHCSYNPRFDGSYDASTKLEQIENNLRKLLEDWVQAIVEYLEDPMNQETINLMVFSKQQQINEFIGARELSSFLSDSFIDVLNEALSGLVKKEVSKEEIGTKLLGEGKPMSLQELRANFEEFLSELIKGEEDPEKIRVILG